MVRRWDGARRNRAQRSEFGHRLQSGPLRTRSGSQQSEAPILRSAAAAARQRGLFGTGPAPPITPAVPPLVAVPLLGGGCPGAPVAGAVGTVPGTGGASGPLPPITPPIDPKGECTGQNAVGSVPGMNDSI